MIVPAGGIGQCFGMQISFGPVPAESARVWIENARIVLDGVRAAGDALPVELPSDIEAAFRHYLDEWHAIAERVEAEGAPFEWSAEIDRDHARHLVVYFFSLLSLDDELWAAHSLPFTPPEAQPFIDALSNAVIEALAAEDEEVGPSIAASWPSGEIHRPWRADPGRPFRVVVVDDTEDVRLLLTMTLQIDGRFEVAGEAKDGQEVIDMCRSLQPDGVLLDVMMPGMDGLTALPELRAACPSTRIVMLSANDQVDLIDRAMAAGADEWVTKASSLDRALEALLGEG
jgi:two-component system chemotaxis response regulator CheY